MKRVSSPTLVLSTESSRQDAIVTKNFNADRNSVLCFNACPRAGGPRYSDDTLFHSARGLPIPCARCDDTICFQFAQTTIQHTTLGASPRTLIQRTLNFGVWKE